MDETKASDKPGSDRQSIIDMAEFLETYPPGSKAIVDGRDLGCGSIIYEGFTRHVFQPNIHLFCSSAQCRKVTIFCPSGTHWRDTDWSCNLLRYFCQDCRKSSRTYALATRDSADGKNVLVNKIGEWPFFAPRLPARVVSLIGAERDLFLKGHQAENQGLGIGAFAYYRRVVDSQWRRLITEIIRVVERVGASEQMLAVLRQAATETQFSTAVELIKDGIPESLRIYGHNPLTLLYRALSEGLHDKSDNECLELARTIRMVLTELAERIGQVLKDERELHEAVTRLLTRKRD